MKIIHLISGGDVGGAKTHVLSLLAGLQKTETVHLVCFTEGEFVREARTLEIPTTVIPEKKLSRCKAQILALIRSQGCELIHCHGARANLMGMLLKKEAGIPIVSTVHSDYRLDYMGRPLAALTFGNINKIALRCFHGWIGVSHGMTRLLSSRGFDPQRLYTLYNGVDFSQNRPTLPRNEFLKQIGLEVQEDTVVFGIAARINPVKDMTTLIKAFARAVEECPNIRLAIAGEGEEETAIRKLADTLCPPGTVCFAGWLQDVDSFYHALDVNLLTSLSETFPYALTEGARMGCATIASAVGGVPYLIDDRVNGLLFTPRDEVTLAQHMVLLAKDAPLRHRMGQALLEKTRRDFSLDVMVERQKKIYATILRRFSRPKQERDGVVICGAYGKGNIGDNAILNAIVEQLRRRDPDLPITALSRDPKETRQCAGVDSVYTFRMLKIGRLMRKSKLYISGGGTLMQDVTSTRSLLYYLYSIRQAAKNGCKVMLYGCGVGPISRPCNRARTQKVLNRYSDVITVRDGYSLDTLRQLGVTAPEIHLNADPALLIDPPDSDQLRGYLHRCGIREGEHYFMLAVRPWKGYKEKLDAIAAAAEYTYKTYGLIPLLYAMEPQRDMEAIAALKEKLSCPCLCLRAGIDGAEVIALVRRMGLVISMRLHTLIFAAGQGIPMVGIVYDPKVSGFLEHLEQHFYLPLERSEEKALTALVDEALKVQRNSDKNIARLRELCLNNAELAARLLKE